MKKWINIFLISIVFSMGGYIYTSHKYNTVLLSPSSKIIYKTIIVYKTKLVYEEDNTDKNIINEDKILLTSILNNTNNHLKVTLDDNQIFDIDGEMENAMQSSINRNDNKGILDDLKDINKSNKIGN